MAASAPVRCEIGGSTSNTRCSAVKPSRWRDTTREALSSSTIFTGSRMSTQSSAGTPSCNSRRRVSVVRQTQTLRPIPRYSCKDRVSCRKLSSGSVSTTKGQSWSACRRVQRAAVGVQMCKIRCDPEASVSDNSRCKRRRISLPNQVEPNDVRIYIGFGKCCSPNRPGPKYTSRGDMAGWSWRHKACNAARLPSEISAASR